MVRQYIVQYLLTQYRYSLCTDVHTVLYCKCKVHARPLVSLCPSLPPMTATGTRNHPWRAGKKKVRRMVGGLSRVQANQGGSPVHAWIGCLFIFVCWWDGGRGRGLEGGKRERERDRETEGESVRCCCFVSWLLLFVICCRVLCFVFSTYFCMLWLCCAVCCAL